jgi:NAD+-dependent protein deacetylase sirtuin 5
MAPSSDIASFREALAASTQVAILTGAGLSAGSGIPTYRGSGGVWNTVDQKLATVKGFEEDPVRVWRFHHTKRQW